MSSLSEEIPGDAPGDAVDASTPSAALAEITSHLAEGDGQRAASLLVDSLAQGSWPSDLPLEEWLETRISDEQRARLASAFAHYPCFVCANGVERCDPCGGSGFTAVAQVCAACIGLGEKRCDFCNGAGLATYNIVPLPLRANVVTARAARAAKYLQGLLQKRPHAATEATASRYLKDITKLLGVMENAVLAAEQLVDARVLAPDAAAHLSAACAQRAATADVRIRETLQRLSRFHDSQAASLPPIDAENARAKAEFYSKLSQSSSFEGTGISHPFLNRTRGGD